MMWHTSQFMWLASALIGVTSLGEGRGITADRWPPKAALPNLAGGDIPYVVTAYYPNVTGSENSGYFVVADHPMPNTIYQVKVENVQQSKITVVYR